MSTIALPWIEPEPLELNSLLRGVATRGLVVGGAALLAVLAARSSLDAASVEPSAASVRFNEVGTAAVSVAGALEVASLPWLTAAAGESAPGGSTPGGGFTGLRVLNALLFPMPLQVLGPVQAISVYQGPGSSAEPVCTVLSEEVPNMVSCDSPEPPTAYAATEAQSAYETSGTNKPDMSRCSVCAVDRTAVMVETCSTIGVIVPPAGQGQPLGVGACSAIGEDFRQNPPLFGPTTLVMCSTKGGTGMMSMGKITTCSIQPTDGTPGVGKTGGGGCSAGSLGEDDERESTMCSVTMGSEDGSICSVSGDSDGQVEVDCSSGANHPDKESTCSTFPNGGEDSFCSVKAGESGKAKASCSAWDMPHMIDPKDKGSGDSNCSVIGDGAGNCSVQGSSGGGMMLNGSVDGFCTSAPGGGNPPGTGDATCSIDPTGDGMGEGKCSAFMPNGMPYPNQPTQVDGQTHCFLPM